MTSLVSFITRPQNKAHGTAVVICPGGAYAHLAMDHEGKQVAEWFNKLGVDTFILKYRLNTWDNKKYKYPAQFDDATRAVRLVRESGSQIWIRSFSYQDYGILGRWPSGIHCGNSF
ncbi:MAG: hypothetical protein U0T82_09840 [Bacteroidales bacterium]